MYKLLSHASVGPVRGLASRRMPPRKRAASIEKQPASEASSAAPSRLRSGQKASDARSVPPPKTSAAGTRRAPEAAAPPAKRTQVGAAVDKLPGFDASLEPRKFYQRSTVAQLRQDCRDLDFDDGGSKAELVERLVSYEMEKPNTDDEEEAMGDEDDEDYGEEEEDKAAAVSDDEDDDDEEEEAGPSHGGRAPTARDVPRARAEGPACCSSGPPAVPPAFASIGVRCSGKCRLARPAPTEKNKDGRGKCGNLGCSNHGAVYGCKPCGIRLCSMECINAHVFEGATIKQGLKPVQFHDWYTGE